MLDVFARLGAILHLRRQPRFAGNLARDVAQFEIGEGAELIEVRFIDSGPGICDDARDHLFEPMWTTKPTGSGFGLSIAREMLAQDGGAIDVDPTAVGGACFNVRLPLAEVAHGM